MHIKERSIQKALGLTTRFLIYVEITYRNGHRGIRKIFIEDVTIEDAGIEAIARITAQFKAPQKVVAKYARICDNNTVFALRRSVPFYDYKFDAGNNLWGVQT